MTERLTVLACGDRARGDDAAGLLAAAMIARRLPGVRVSPVGQLDPGDLATALRTGRCVVVDTVRGVAAGDVVVLTLRALLESASVTPASSHVLPIPAVVALVEALGADLGRGSFVGIGGTTFELGAPLSRAVREGLPAFVEASELALRGEAARCA